MTVISIEFVFGVYLQIKLIKRVMNEKAVTWEMEIYHSLVLIIHFTLSLSLQTTIYIFPDISHYTGFWWFCEVYRAIKIWGIFAISLHSFSVSVQKYIIIVYWKVNSYVVRKIETIVFWIFLSVPILWSAGLMARFPSSSPFSSAILPEVKRTLLNDTGYILGGIQLKYLEKVKFSNNYLFCDFNDSNTMNYPGATIIYFITEFYCVGQTSITMVINANIIEAFLYFKIFRFVSR